MPDHTSESATSAAWRTVTGMGNGFVEMLPMLAAGLVVFLVFWAIAAGTRRSVQSMARRRLEFPGAATAFGRLAYVTILLLGVLVAITVAFPSMTPASLFSALGIGGVAIGFAFKDIFQNLVAGILLLVRQPFRAGDEIRSGAFTGVVESIETRATYIRTYDGQRIIVPNSVVYAEPMTVITAYDLLRSQYDVGIGYGDDVTKARAIALEAVAAVEGVLDDPPPDVLRWDLRDRRRIFGCDGGRDRSVSPSCRCATACFRPCRKRSPPRASICPSRRRSCSSTIRPKTPTAIVRVSGRGGRLGWPRRPRGNGAAPDVSAPNRR